MAEVTKIVSLANLTSYDTLIKQYLKDADDVVNAKSIKTVLWDSTNEKIKFYKKENAALTDTADYEVAISSSDVANLKSRVGMDSTLSSYQEKSNLTDIMNVLTGANTVDGSVAKIVKDASDAVIGKSGDASTASTIYGAKAYSDANLSTAKTYTDDEIKKLDTTADIALATAADGVVTIKAVKEADGIIAASEDTTKDVTLAKVATTGAAADVSVADAAGKITATTVESALAEIVNKADTNASAITVLNGDNTTDGSVAKSIKTAIDALDNSDAAVSHQFVTAAVQEDGKVTVSRAALAADDIPTLTLAKISDAGTAAASDVATVAIGTDKEDTAALPTVGQVETYVAEEIAGLEGAMHFVAVITRTEGQTDAQAIAAYYTAKSLTPKAGDVVVMSDNAKEYIYDGTAWDEVGDEASFVKKTTQIAGVAINDGIDKASMLTALNVEDGAQVNVIETVKVNDTALTVTDKAVNVTVATGATDGTIAVNGVDVKVKSIGGAAYKAEDYYEVAGTAQTKIEALDATVTTVTEADPTPVLNISVTETDGKLTAISASVKDETFDAYGTAQSKIEALDATVSQESSDTNPVAVSVVETDGKLTSVTASVVLATADDINGLFPDEEE